MWLKQSRYVYTIRQRFGYYEDEPTLLIGVVCFGELFLNKDAILPGVFFKPSSINKKNQWAIVEPLCLACCGWAAW